MAVPLGIAAFGLAAAIVPYNNGPFPGVPTFGPAPQVEQLYQENGRVVGSAILNPDRADQACPKGYEVRGQGKREDGARVYLVWNLRCR
jgi:hypothetical protein